MATTRTSKAKSSKAKKPTAAKTSKSQAAPAVFTPSEPGGTSSETANDKPGRGRPTDFRPEYVEQGRKLWQAGFTDQEVADFFGVRKGTIYNWQAAHPDFLNSAVLGKDAPDDRVARSLYARGNGYEWTEEQPYKLRAVRYVDGERVEEERVEIVKVRRHVPPDTQAAVFWLRNRKRAEWPDTNKGEITGKDGSPLIPENINSREAAKAILDILREAKFEEGEGCPGDEVYEDDYVNTDDAVNSYPPGAGSAPCEQPVNTIAAPASTPAAPVNTAPRRLRFDPTLGKLVED